MKFRYFKPLTIEEALTLKKVDTENSLFIAGGTDIFLLMKKGIIAPKTLISLRNIKDLYGIYDVGNNIVIKSSTPLRDIELSPIVRCNFPALYDALIRMASIQIRNVGTLGGNICNASPAADTLSPLLVYEAKIKIIDNTLKESILDLKDFFIGPKKTLLNQEQLLTEIIIKKPSPTTSSAYYKFMKRGAMDLANVGVAVNLNLNGEIITDAKIGLTTVAPTPIRAFKTENFLKDKIFSEEILYQAGEIAKDECSPITDIRGIDWHKRKVVAVYVRRASLEAFRRLRK